MDWQRGKLVGYLDLSLQLDNTKISWEFVFPGSCYDEDHLHDNTLFSRNNNLKYLVSKCFFLELRPNGAVRINSTSDDVKTYVETNKFDSCSSGSQTGGSLFFSDKGEFVQTKNSFINSTNSNEGLSFYIIVSDIPNYKNHANETVVCNCGSTEQNCRITAGIGSGLVIISQCNITQNRVKQDVGGYALGISFNSYITCVNVNENNQSSKIFNAHLSSESCSSTFKITSCNYIRNKSPSGSLICFSYSNISMSYCCIRENEIPLIFYLESCTIIFENSTTDNNKSYMGFSDSSLIFKNTDISFENDCSLMNSDIPDSLKYKCRRTNPNNDENEEEDNAYVRNHINFFYFFMTSKQFRSQT